MMSLRSGVVLLGLFAALPAFSAETVYAKADVTSVRFLDDRSSGPSFDANDKLEVLFRRDGMVRVRKGEKFGWVNESDVSPQPDLESLMKQLQLQMNPGQ